MTRRRNACYADTSRRGAGVTLLPETTQTSDGCRQPQRGPFCEKTSQFLMCVHRRRNIKSRGVNPDECMVRAADVNRVLPLTRGSAAEIRTKQQSQTALVAGLGGGRSIQQQGHAVRMPCEHAPKQTTSGLRTSRHGLEEKSMKRLATPSWNSTRKSHMNSWEVPKWTKEQTSIQRVVREGARDIYKHSEPNENTSKSVAAGS